MRTHLQDVYVDPSKSCRSLNILKSVSKFDGRIHFLPFDNDQSSHSHHNIWNRSSFFGQHVGPNQFFSIALAPHGQSCMLDVSW